MTTAGFVEVVELGEAAVRFFLVTFCTFQHLIQCGTVTTDDNTSSLLYTERGHKLRFLYD